MSRDYAEINLSRRERVRRLLSDGQWHGPAELLSVGGVRYGARVHELQRLGFLLDKRDEEPQGREYRLASSVLGRPKGKRVKVYLDESDAEELLRGRLTLQSRCALADALGSFRHNREKL